MAKLTVEAILSRCEKLLQNISSGGVASNVNITGNGAGLNVESTQTQVRTHVGSINDNIGGKGDSAATSDTGTFSIHARIQRALQYWTTLLGRVPSMNLGSGTQAGALRVTLANDGIGARQKQTSSVQVSVSRTGPVNQSLNGVTAKDITFIFAIVSPPSAALTISIFGCAHETIGNIVLIGSDTVPVGFVGNRRLTITNIPIRAFRVELSTPGSYTDVVITQVAYM